MFCGGSGNHVVEASRMCISEVGVQTIARDIGGRRR